jgi:DNA excision repair protein ERCC-2
MEHLLKEWYDTGIIAEIIKHRSLFIEKKDTIETESNIVKFRKACDIGRGAIFLAIARGKIAEGVDF